MRVNQQRWRVARFVQFKKKEKKQLVQGNEATLYSKNERGETGRIEGRIRGVGAGVGRRWQYAAIVLIFHRLKKDVGI